MSSNSMDRFEKEVLETREWFASPRFKGLKRLYSARQIVEQRGTIVKEYTVAKNASKEFYEYLRELFAKKESITTFGPYSPGQAVMMKQMGIKGIYLGGWATSAKGSKTEDLGADLASYPLSQVPEEAAVLVRALLVQDQNQQFLRSRMTEEDRKKTPEIDYRPFIIADADTGHGGDAHVRNLIRRFIEAGVSGYHIEDQRPGTKKCGHQGGKVLVAVEEQIARLNTARFQMDVMKVPGILVARTDAEAATLLDNNNDGRDHPFILGVTNLDIPSYKNCSSALLRRFYDKGIEEINGHLLLDLPEWEIDEANAWFEQAGISEELDAIIDRAKSGIGRDIEIAYLKASELFVKAWEQDSGLKTYCAAVEDVMKFRLEEGAEFSLSIDEWNEFAGHASHYEAQKKVQEMGLDVKWDWELARTAEGYYQIKAGINYAITKSLAVADYADIIWMETKTANLEDARLFAEAIHAVYPDKMLAYNLSPSFNWDTTGMTEEEMKQFPKEIGKLGFVFNFITYGGHQIDGLAAEEFATDLIQNGMLALAKIQRKFRLLESPYTKPQTYVGGPRLDAALSASLGRNATTAAMGKGSTEFQHAVQTEVPVKVVEGWLENWTKKYNIVNNLHVKLRPHQASSELLELSIWDEYNNKMLDIVFASIQDRRKKHILSVRDQNTLNPDFKRKRLMTLVQVFLIHRYKINSVHYVTPTEDNRMQAESMQRLSIFSEVYQEIGDIIVADVNAPFIAKLVVKDSEDLDKLISKN